MKTFTIKLIIPSLIFLCIINSSISPDSCSEETCPRTSNTTEVVVVHSPFRITSLQPEHCANPGFDLYCNDTLGTLIQLPNDVVLHVDDIDYYYDRITLSDPFEYCLPQKLLSLNLSSTPFQQISNSTKYWLYNCSAYHNSSGFDRVDCLSGSSYTVISATHVVVDFVGSNCTFLRVLTVPIYYNDSLNSILAIDLTWSGPEDALPSSSSSSSHPIPYSYSSNVTFSPAALVFVLIGTLLALLTMLCCCCHFWLRRNSRLSSTRVVNNNNNQTSMAATTGLDQVTIDSYPVVVVGASGHLIKPEDDTLCPICLSDYSTGETLKMLPECDHQFHAGCIDEWLRSKGQCPICRASAPRT